MSGSLTSTDVANIVKVIGLLSKFDWKALKEAFESQDLETKLKEGAITVQEVAAIVGIFVPIVAVVANDLQAITLLFAIFDAMKAFPVTPPPPHTVNVWGSDVSDEGLFY